jgi:hypothetical protein
VGHRFREPGGENRVSRAAGAGGCPQWMMRVNRAGSACQSRSQRRFKYCVGPDRRASSRHDSFRLPRLRRLPCRLRRAGRDLPGREFADLQASGARRGCLRHRVRRRLEPGQRGGPRPEEVGPDSEAVPIISEGEREGMLARDGRVVRAGSVLGREEAAPSRPRTSCSPHPNTRSAPGVPRGDRAVEVQGEDRVAADVPHHKSEECRVRRRPSPVAVVLPHGRRPVPAVLPSP